MTGHPSRHQMRTYSLLQTSSINWQLTLWCTHANRQGVDISFTVFLCVFLFVCTVTDFSGKDKASGVKFCKPVHRRARQGIAHFGELCSPRSQNLTNVPARSCCNEMLLGFCDSHAYQVRTACGRRVDVASACVDIRQSPKTDVLVCVFVCVFVRLQISPPGQS